LLVPNGIGLGEERNLLVVQDGVSSHLSLDWVLVRFAQDPWARRWLEQILEEVSGEHRAGKEG
jgi:hypothetical protein